MLVVEVVVLGNTLQPHLQSEDDAKEVVGDPIGPANSNGSADDEKSLLTCVLALTFKLFEINGPVREEIETIMQRLGYLMLKICVNQCNILHQ